MKVPSIPEWIADAVLALLFEAAGAPPPHKTLLAKLWARRFKDDVDARRVLEVALARTHPERPATWKEAFALGEYFARAPGVVERRSPAVAKKSYRVLQRRLEANPGRYYAPADGKRVFARQGAALKRLVEIMEAEVSNNKE